MAGLVACGCALLAPPGDLVSAALAARGGPLPGFRRESALRVIEGFPGAWRWEIAFHVPEQLRVTLHTDAEDQMLSSDGTVVRTWVGGAQVSEEPAAGSGARSLARFVALSNLDALADAERVAWQELDAAQRPAGASRALRAHFRDAPLASSRLGFDERLRLVFADGPVSIPGLGDGTLEARYGDYRRVGRWWLPFAIDYRFRGAPLLEERVVALAPGEQTIP